LHESNVLSVDVTVLAHPFTECVEEVLVCGRGLRTQEPDDRNLRRLLRARREGPRDGRAANERDERAALHSMTSSARASSLYGISRPIDFAVLRLMTSSNLVGCRTGRSAGLSPLRMRPT